MRRRFSTRHAEVLRGSETRVPQRGTASRDGVPSGCPTAGDGFSGFLLRLWRGKDSVLLVAAPVWGFSHPGVDIHVPRLCEIIPLRREGQRVYDWSSARLVPG